jgi:hypothetical protein
MQWLIVAASDALTYKYALRHNSSPFCWGYVRAFWFFNGFLPLMELDGT